MLRRFRVSLPIKRTCSFSFSSLSSSNSSPSSSSSSLSYDNGSSSYKLLGETIGQHLTRQSQLYSSHLALIVKHQNISWTYQQFHARVTIIANHLLSLGIKPGDRVGIWSPNNAEWTLTQFATAKMGAILVNINPSYQRDELQYALNLVQCKALILASSLKSTNYIEIIQSLCPELAHCRPGQLSSQSIPSLSHVIRIDPVPTPGMLNFTDLLPYPSNYIIESNESKESPTLHSLRSYLHFDDPINIQFTSGTTGRPKGATLTHHNILNNGYFVGNGIGLTPADKVCIPVPLYHCFGMVMGNLACITHGSAMVYPAHVFDPIETLKTISSEACSVLYGVPTMFLSQLDHPDFHRYNLTSLRSGITAGSICSGYLMKRLINEMNLKGITNCYGMTEVSPVCTQTKQDDSFEKKITSVGTVHPHVEIQIVKPGTRILPGSRAREQGSEGEENNYMKFESIMTEGTGSKASSSISSQEIGGGEGLVVPRGVTGELWVRGYSVMKGYWNDVTKTKESITDDGWMKTGDLASMSEDGYIVIEGRLKDMIIRGGENIYPKEIEEYLSHHPMIQDVQIVGLPDKKYGEELCAWIVLKQHQTQQVYHHVTEDDIRQYCRGKIAHYKIPRYIRFVDSFPLTITGKIRKIEIRERMIAELGLGEGGQDKKDSLA